MCVSVSLQSHNIGSDYVDNTIAARIVSVLGCSEQNGAEAHAQQSTANGHDNQMKCVL